MCGFSKTIGCSLVALPVLLPEGDEVGRTADNDGEGGVNGGCRGDDCGDRGVCQDDDFEPGYKALSLRKAVFSTRSRLIVDGMEGLSSESLSSLEL